MTPNHQNNFANSTIDDSPRLWHRLGRLFRRTEAPREPILVKVWDATRGAYREVDLLNREDPLWYAARSLAGMQEVLSRKSAA